MEKNKTMKMISITLLLVMIALVLVSGTYAKYTSTASGSDSARVAKWTFKVGDADITTSNTFKFDLFKTIKEADGTSNEDDVTGSKVIAPGTGGSFAIVLKNESEVSAKYGIKYTVTNDNEIPVQFSTDGKTWSKSLTDVAASDTDTKLAANNGTKTITVQWKWAYEDTNESTKAASEAKDLELGKDGTATISVSAEVTATQVN